MIQIADDVVVELLALLDEAIYSLESLKKENISPMLLQMLSDDDLAKRIREIKHKIEEQAEEV